MTLEVRQSSSGMPDLRGGPEAQGERLGWLPAGTSPQGGPTAAVAATHGPHMTPGQRWARRGRTLHPGQAGKDRGCDAPSGKAELHGKTHPGRHTGVEEDGPRPCEKRRIRGGHRQPAGSSGCRSHPPPPRTTQPLNTRPTHPLTPAAAAPTPHPGSTYGPGGRGATSAWRPSPRGSTPPQHALSPAARGAGRNTTQAATPPTAGLGRLREAAPDASSESLLSRPAQRQPPDCRPLAHLHRHPADPISSPAHTRVADLARPHMQSAVAIWKAAAGSWTDSRLPCPACLAHGGVAAQVQPAHALIPQRHRQPCSVHRLCSRLPPVDAEQQPHLDVCMGASRQGSLTGAPGRGAAIRQ